MKFLAGAISAIFLGLMFFSLFYVSGPMEMSHGMSGMGDCPFMMNQEVLCSMNVNEHIGAWKALFFELIPSTFTILLVLGAAVLVTATAPHLLAKRLLHLIPIHRYRLCSDVHAHIVRPLQELFSSGILHPKLF